MKSNRLQIRKKPNWLNQKEYPFQSKYITLNNYNIHYIDEGSGEILLFVHGTPSWSFEYRKIIKGLSKNYRCIAYDHIGFGLSDKPEEFNYTVENHSNHLSLFIDELNLKNINLVFHDFGGPISLKYVVSNKIKIKRMIAFNTWAWSNEGEVGYEKMKSFLKSPLLPFLYKRLNFSPKFLLPKMFSKNNSLPSEIKKHYVKPFKNSTERNGALGFAKSLLNEQDLLSNLEKRLDEISKVPILFIWGKQDKVMPVEYLRKFEKKFKNSESICFENSSHFPHEENPIDTIEVIEKFLQKDVSNTKLR